MKAQAAPIAPGRNGGYTSAYQREQELLYGRGCDESPGSEAVKGI